MVDVSEEESESESKNLKIVILNGVILLSEWII